MEMNANETQELEQLAETLIAKYPEGYLTDPEVHMPKCKMAIRGSLHGIDTPRIILEGSYQELRAFEIAYKRIKAASPSFSVTEMAIDGYAPETLPGEIMYWQNKQAQEA